MTKCHDIKRYTLIYSHPRILLFILRYSSLCHNSYQHNYIFNHQALYHYEIRNNSKYPHLHNNVKSDKSIPSKQSLKSASVAIILIFFANIQDIFHFSKTIYNFNTSSSLFFSHLPSRTSSITLSLSSDFIVCH